VSATGVSYRLQTSVRTRRTESAQTDPESPEHTLGAVDNVAEAPFKTKSKTRKIHSGIAARLDG
jgi:hypothetical protein